MIASSSTASTGALTAGAAAEVLLLVDVIVVVVVVVILEAIVVALLRRLLLVTEIVDEDLDGLLTVDLEPIGADEILLVEHRVVGAQEAEVLELQRKKKRHYIIIRSFFRMEMRFIEENNIDNKSCGRETRSLEATAKKVLSSFRIRANIVILAS